MSQSGPQDGKTTVPDRFASTTCQHCPHDREHHSDERALEQAKTHNTITGHTVEVTAPQWSRPLTVIGRPAAAEVTPDA